MIFQRSYTREVYKLSLHHILQVISVNVGEHKEETPLEQMEEREDIQ